MGSVQLEYPSDFDAPGRLREAWKVLRFKHPEIAMEIRSSEKRYYPVSDEKTLEDWCNSTFRIEQDVSSADDFFSQLRLAESHATCHWIPVTNQLAIISAHDRWDGIGQTMLLDELLSELESPSPPPTAFNGDEAKNLVPTLDTVLGISAPWEPSWEKRADELIDTFLEHQPSIGLPLQGDPKTLPGNSVRVEEILPANVTTALRKAARAQGITLTSAMHASVIQETVRANPKSPASRYISLAVFNLRKYCPEPFDGPLHAPSLRLLALPFSVDPRVPWHELTRILHPIYHQSWTPGDSDLLFVRAPFVEKKATTLFSVPVDSDTPPPTEPNLNSLGVMEKFIKPSYGPVTVTDVSPMAQMITPQIYVHSWSWNGELHLSASYNEAYYTTDYASKWLASVRSNLIENLGV
jgi:hypothetical protein